MTTAQLALPIADLVEPDYSEAPTLPEQFALFHAANPHVADALEHLAAEWLAGHRRCGVKAVYERLRWEIGVRTDSEPVLNNNWTAFYARLLLARHPEWTGRIQTRRSCADNNNHEEIRHAL